MADENVFEPSEILEMVPVTDDLGGRVLPSLTFYDPNYDKTLLPDYMDEEDWVLFVRRGDGKYHIMKGMAAESAYYGTESASNNRDVLIPFVNTYCQYLSWPDMLGLFPGLIEDIRNFGAVLSKLAVYQRTIEGDDLFTRRMIITELEYLFSTMRRFYDLFQGIASKTWDIVELDSGGTNSMPYDSFSRVALSDESPRDAENLAEAYGFPADLATFYSDEAETFSKIKSFKDNMEHHGETVKTIYPGEEGLSVDSTDNPYSQFDVWSDDQIGENGLAPLWPFVAIMINHTLSIMPRFIEALSNGGLGVLPALMPDYNVYLRGQHLHNLARLEELRNEDQWGENFTDDITDSLGISVN